MAWRSQSLDNLEETAWDGLADNGVTALGRERRVQVPAGSGQDVLGGHWLSPRGAAGSKSSIPLGSTLLPAGLNPEAQQGWRSHCWIPLRDGDGSRVTWPSGTGDCHCSPPWQLSSGSHSVGTARGTICTCTSGHLAPPASGWHRPSTAPLGAAPLGPFACQQVTARDVAWSPAPGARELRPNSARERAGPGPWGDNSSATHSPVNELSFVPQPTLHQARPLRTVPSWD